MENIVQDINTQRLLLRKLKYDDAEDLFLYASGSLQVMEY